MNDGNYLWGKRGMSLIPEFVKQLQVHSFLKSSDGGVFYELFDKIDNIVTMIRDTSKNQVNITSQWSKCVNFLEEALKRQIEEAFNTFKTSGSTESKLFAYWNNYLSI